MINTILVEDDLYIQKHFVDRLAADGEFHLVGVFRDAFEAEKHCDATVKLVLIDVHKRVRQVEYRTQAPDHPILWSAEESYYLKFYVFQIVDEK